LIIHDIKVFVKGFLQIGRKIFLFKFHA
jgi:hypothetical protein